jgi:GT2 family glycosyltransferase
MDSATCVVIINYNAGDALLRSVAAVLASDQALRLIVADNASTDGSGEKLRHLYAGQDSMELRQNAHNLGFARAVNACALAVTEPYLLILNPDCELAPGALAELKRALQQDPQAALAAPRVVDSQGRVLRGTWRSYPEPLKALMTASGLWRLGRWLPRLRGVESAAGELPQETCRAEAVSGACMLVRTSMFRQLGGFDEAFGLHFEDLDLMYRLRRQQHYCLYVPVASAIHHPGTSSRSRPWWVHRQKHLGMQRFFHKHYADHYSRPGRCVMIAGIWLHYVLTLPLVWLRR